MQNETNDTTVVGPISVTAANVSSEQRIAELAKSLAVSRDNEQDVTNAYAELLRDMATEREMRANAQIALELVNAALKGITSDYDALLRELINVRAERDALKRAAEEQDGPDYIAGFTIGDGL